MLKKRIIFTLLYDSGNFVLSRNFRRQKIGDVHWVKKNYNIGKISQSVDEIFIINIS